MSEISVALSILVVLIMAQGVSFAQEQAETDATPVFPRYSIEDSEVRKISPSFTGSEYLINVFLPPGYHGKHERHPVVYVTDAASHFALMARISQISSPHMGLNFIVVGVEIKKDDPIGHWAVRSRDLTPTPVKGLPYSGGAENYVRFFQEELFPFIDSNYNTDPTDRTFCGHSWGGLFGMYVLLNHTEVFDRYVLSSPSLNSECFEYEKEYARTHTDMPVDLFVSQGEFELAYYERDGKNKFIELMEILESRSYENLNMKWMAMKDATHASVSPRALSEGIWHVFSDYIYPDDFVGRYVFSPDYAINITKKNGRFYLKVNVEGLESESEAEEYPLLGRSDYEKKYYCRKLGGISFVKDGETVRMTYPIGDNEFTLPRTALGDKDPRDGKALSEFETYVGEYEFDQGTVTVREENDCLYAYFKLDGDNFESKITSDAEGIMVGIKDIYLFPLSFGRNGKGEVESLSVFDVEGSGKKVTNVSGG
jgi:predicted alpha/beta superfamily hydrolase